MPFAIDVCKVRMPGALLGMLLGSALLGGCVTTQVPPAPPPPPAVVVVPPPPPPAPLPPPATAADLATREVLAFHERLRQLSPADVAREQARLGDPQASPLAAVQLALVLAQARTPADTNRALALLDGVLRGSSPEAAALQPVARLLSARLGEQRRLEEAIDRQNQQARDTQRKLDQLNDKLEALKAIERSLVTRPGTPASGAGPLRSSTP